MEIVSTALRNSKLAYARETSAVVEFVVNNTPYPAGTTVSVSGEHEISNKDGVIEGNRSSNLIATFENIGFLLDGNYYLAVEGEDYGWLSDVLSEENGTFASNPYLTISMSSTYVDKISIIWGQDEKPLEYKVIVNGSSTIEVDNGDNIINIQNNVTSIKIEIVKWFEGHKRAKIQCVDLGITKIYTDEEITDLEIVENINHQVTDIPSNSCSVTIDNIGGEFNILNPEGYYQYLSEGAPIVIKLGHKTIDGTQYVQMGKFFLTEYEQDGLKMTFKAIDILGQLDKVTFYGWGRQTNDSPDVPSAWEDLDGGGYYGDYTIAELITRLMGKIGLTSDEYWIDPVLNQYDWSHIEPVGWETIQSKPTARDLLNKIQIMYNLNIYVNREGKICFSYFFDNPSYIFTTGKTPTENSIMLDDMIEKPIVNEIEQLKEIRYLPTIQDFFTSPEEKTVISNVQYAVNGAQEIFMPTDMYLSDSLLLSPYWSKTGTANITKITVYNYGVKINVTGTGTITFDFIDYTRNYTEEFNETFINDKIEKGYVMELRHERLYDFDWLSEYKGKFTPVNELFILELFNRNRKYEYEINWRQDITNNLGDIVLIEHDFDKTKHMMITQQIYKYNGALSGTTKGVGN